MAHERSDPARSSLRALLELARAPLYADRREAGRALAAALEEERGPDVVVLGLARGGVEVAAEVARALEAPLDVVAVRKIGHPYQPEYGLGAVTPGDGVYLRGSDGLSSDGLSEEQLTRLVEETKAKAVELDRRLHGANPPLELAGRTVLVVDDGLATGATMIAALRFAKASGAVRVVTAVPVGARSSLALLESEASRVVCPHALTEFFAVGAWYASFDQVEDETVIRLVAENRGGYVS